MNADRCVCCHACVPAHYTCTHYTCTHTRVCTHACTRAQTRTHVHARAHAHAQARKGRRHPAPPPLQASASSTMSPSPHSPRSPCPVSTCRHVAPWLVTIMAIRHGVWRCDAAWLGRHAGGACAVLCASGRGVAAAACRRGPQHPCTTTSTTLTLRDPLPLPSAHSHTHTPTNHLLLWPCCCSCPWSSRPAGWAARLHVTC